MKHISDNIKTSLLKQQEALARYRARKAEFLVTKEQITREIEEARIIWEKTMEQMPNLPFGH
jgi:hypothetical protein